MIRTNGCGAGQHFSFAVHYIPAVAVFWYQVFYFCCCVGPWQHWPSELTSPVFLMRTYQLQEKAWPMFIKSVTEQPGLFCHPCHTSALWDCSKTSLLEGDK